MQVLDHTSLDYLQSYGFQFDQEDLRYVELKADRIYNQINRRRASRGLAPFDDASPPPAVIKALSNISISQYSMTQYGSMLDGPWQQTLFPKSDCTNAVVAAHREVKAKEAKAGVWGR